MCDLLIILIITCNNNGWINGKMIWEREIEAQSCKLSNVLSLFTKWVVFSPYTGNFFLQGPTLTSSVFPWQLLCWNHRSYSGRRCGARAQAAAGGWRLVVWIWIYLTWIKCNCIGVDCSVKLYDWKQCDVDQLYVSFLVDGLSNS